MSDKITMGQQDSNILESTDVVTITANRRLTVTFLIVAFALLIRTALLLYNIPLPIKYYTDSDAYNYEKIALNLVTYGEYSNSSGEPFTPDIFRPPVFPIFIATVYRLFGQSPAMVVGLHSLIGSLSAGLTFLLAWKLGISLGGSILAGLIFALEPLTVLFTNLLMSETIFVAFLLTGLVSLLQFRQSPKLGWLLFAAAALAASALTRPIAQFLPIVLLLILVLFDRKITRPIHALLFAGISMALIYSWAFRNQFEAGIWTVSGKDAYNLAYYRAKHVLEDAEGLSDDAATERIDAMINALAPENAKNAAERANAERRVSLEIFRQYPSSTLKVHIEGALRFFANPGLHNICAQIERSKDVSGCETKTADDLGILDRVFFKLGEMSALQIGVAGLSIAFLILNYSGAVVGAYHLLREKRWFNLFYLIGPIAYFSLLSAGGESTSRFRLPVVPFFAILCAIGLVYLWNRNAKRAARESL